MWSVFACYLILINIIAFLAFGVDKLKAKKGFSRIPEGHLFMLALAGGSVGAYVGMRAWHHKTLHRRFCYGLPLIIAAQLVLCVWCICR